MQSDEVRKLMRYQEKMDSEYTQSNYNQGSSRLTNNSSRIPGFYQLPLSERLSIVAKLNDLSHDEAHKIKNFASLSSELTDTFIENAIGTFSLPLGLATNFVINGRNLLVPMAVEETSVLAAASHGAKLARYKGGFKTSSTPPIMTGQIQIELARPVDFNHILNEEKEFLISYANKGQDRLLSRGGGAKDITWKYIPEIKSLVLYVHIHTCDAMGANIVNTMCERLSLFMPDLFPDCDIGLRILTNLNDRRLSRAECVIPPEAFDSDKFSGHEVVERIEKAWLFAKYDIYRAATNNKGVMNGIDPVVIATGNDWRAIEAGAHAYCARNGGYEPLASWQRDKSGNLRGTIEIPMAVGTVGGVTKLHPVAQSALRILGNPNAQELGEIICSVGLAQNLSALRALSSEGIQQGHMSLHRKNLDLLHGATRS